jgi:thiol-disulfide isomerase/thioredoxin
MSGSGRGCIVLAIIGFAIFMYVLLYVIEPVKRSEGTVDRGRVVNYLSEAPETPGEVTRMRTGSQAPDFVYANIDGQVLQLSDFIGTKPVVIDFWATWCPPCQMELPVLQEFYEQHGDKVEIIAISSEQPNAQAAIANTVSSKGLEFIVMHDPTRTISEMFPHTGIPFLVFIDEDGNVVKTESGYNPDVGQEILDTFGLS